MAIYKQAINEELDLTRFIFESESNINKIFKYYSINEEETALAITDNNKDNSTNDNKKEQKRKFGSRVIDFLKRIGAFFKGILDRIMNVLKNLKEKVKPYLNKVLDFYVKSLYMVLVLAWLLSRVINSQKICLIYIMKKL